MFVDFVSNLLGEVVAHAAFIALVCHRFTIVVSGVAVALAICIACVRFARGDATSCKVLCFFMLDLWRRFFLAIFVFSVRLFFNGRVVSHSAIVHGASPPSLPDIGMD